MHVCFLAVGYGSPVFDRFMIEDALNSIFGLFWSLQLHPEKRKVQDDVEQRLHIVGDGVFHRLIATC